MEDFAKSRGSGQKSGLSGSSAAARWRRETRMTDQTEISIREVQQELGIICSFLKSSDPDRNRQAEPKLVNLIERISRDTQVTYTKAGAEIYDLMVRARENLRIGCRQDALAFITEARDRATLGWPAAGEKE
jgi:hypothetical protein